MKKETSSNPHSYDNNEPENIGTRIKKIRLLRGLSQAELAEKIGLTYDRIQKYESGTRKPKEPLTKAIAEALGVQEETLIDPKSNTAIGIIRFLLETEEAFCLKLEKTNGRTCIYFDEEDFYSDRAYILNRLLDQWYDKWIETKNEIFDELPEQRQSDIVNSYYEWKTCYPTYEFSNEDDIKEYKKDKLRKNIEALTLELKKLEEDE